jgi:DNA repair protein RadC
MGQVGTEYVIETTVQRVCDMPVRYRPREEVDRVGFANASDDLLLALLLRHGIPGLNVVQLARRLLHEDYGSLNDLAAEPVEELARRRGMGRVKAQIIKAALELGLRLAREIKPAEIRVRAPGDAANLLRDRVRGLEEEVFWVLLLNARNRLKTEPQEITRGILDASLIHPREVFRRAIRHASAAVIVAHNHPSGDPTPSAEDLSVTRQMIEAGKVVGIPVLDHVILGVARVGQENDFLSLRESGMVIFNS